MAFSLYHTLERLTFFFQFLFCSSALSHVPAIYVLGSSQVDVGNNNSLSTKIKINFYPYGIDFPGGEATGRFSNGKNAADFIAEKLGLPSPKPYLSIISNSNKTSEFLKGANFASGGAGVFNNINQGLCIPFSKQVAYFAKTTKAIAKQIGIEQAYRNLYKSIIVISIGNNDILAYTGVGSSTIKPGITLEEYVHQMISSMRSQLKRMYKHGARKFLIIGAGAQGCLPVERVKQKGWECNEEGNQLSRMFNQKLVSLLEETQSKFSDFRYAFFSMYNGYVELYHKRKTYGFDQVDVACCGGGFLNSTTSCNPKTVPPCSNRTNHLFWDGIHNTEATAGVYMSMAYHGSSPFVHPMNLKQLRDA